MTAKNTRLPGEVYTPEEMRKLLRACNVRYPSGARNRALIAVGYRAGLRIAEALGLYPPDVDTREGIVHVQHGKGDKARTVGLDAGACAIVDHWLEVRRRLGINGRAPLFCSHAEGHRGNRLTTQYVRDMLQRIARMAGIEKRVHFHGFRHTYAWELSKERVPVAEIQRLLGHESLETTGRYLAHIAPHDLINTIRQREWAL